MSFTDQKPFTVTSEDMVRPWLGNRRAKYFRCALCGHSFQPGDIARWVFTNDIPNAGGNPMVCQSCNTPDVIEKWKERCDLFASDKLWWFRRGEDRV